MTDMLARIDEMNLLAERSAGFVWQLRGSDVTNDTLCVLDGYFVPFEPERLFYNLSVWQSIEQLRDYVFKSAHVEMLRRRSAWTAAFERAHLALWWIPAGERPSVLDSAERLRAVHEQGPTPYAFTLKTRFPAPAP